jgi:sulfhydrogenase subunit gamma (sulfur reductase)
VEANIYLPRMAVIQSVRDEAENVKTFTLKLSDSETAEVFSFRPGQFIELTVFGTGEAPFSITSAPGGGPEFELTIAMVGELTEVLHQKREGDLVGVRGPYGNGFPRDQVKGRDLLFMGGGIGLAPLRSLVKMVMAERSDFGKVTVLYGARNPGLLCFRRDLDDWSRARDSQVMVTVDVPDDGWGGHVGLVTSLLSRADLGVGHATAFVCGPPVMIGFAVKELLALGFEGDDIITSLERRMECGVGKCGHCNVGSAHVCMEGPVFSYTEVQALGGTY